MKNRKLVNEKVDRIINEFKKMQVELNEEVDQCITIEEMIRSGEIIFNDKKRALMDNSETIFNNVERVNILDEAIEILEKIKEI